jgi:hypothetical protein
MVDKNRLKDYTVVWFYIANFSERPWHVRARDPEHARDMVFKVYDNPQMREKGKVLVFEGKPALMHNFDRLADMTDLS